MALKISAQPLYHLFGHLKRRLYNIWMKFGTYLDEVRDIGIRHRLRLLGRYLKDIRMEGGRGVRELADFADEQ